MDSYSPALGKASYTCIYYETRVITDYPLGEDDIIDLVDKVDLQTGSVSYKTPSQGMGINT